MFRVKRTTTSYCVTLLSKMQMTPLFLVLLLFYALSHHDHLCHFTWIINPLKQRQRATCMMALGFLVF